MFAQEPLRRRRFRTLRHCISGGEALNAEVIAAWREGTGHHIHEGYGQTETVLLAATFPAIPWKPGSMGRASPGHEIAIVADEGQERPRDTEGDLAVRVLPERPVGMFREYWRNPEETARCHRGDWYVTGDRAAMDADGYLWFVGRADDVINSASYRIGPFEVESALIEHPAVAETAVVGKPDALRGEIVKAFVVLVPGPGRAACLDTADGAALSVPRVHRRRAAMAELDMKALQKKVSAGASYRKLVAAAEAGGPARGGGGGGPPRCGLGICWSSKAAFGALPRPHMAITDVNVCGLHLTWWAYLEDHFTLPTFYMDMPATTDPGAPEYIDYYEGQIREMVAFVERTTARRLDLERLDGPGRGSDLAGHYWKQTMALRRHRPSPMSFRALAGQILPLVPALGAPDPPDFYAALYQQYQADANAGKTPAQGGERYRLIWDGIPIWHHLQVINYFEEKGANFVWEPYTSLNWGNKTGTGRLDLARPFHTLAEKYTNVWTNKPIAQRG